MSEPLVEMGPRMSDAEGLMWRLEKDPYLSSTAANLTVLDSPPDMERLAQRMLRAHAHRPEAAAAGATGTRTAAARLGRRRGLRSHVPPAPPGAGAAGRRARPLRPRDPAHCRPVRSDTPAVADGHHRGLERRSCRAVHAVPPHADGRRRRRAPLAAVPRLRNGILPRSRCRLSPTPRRLRRPRARRKSRATS